MGRIRKHKNLVNAKRQKKVKEVKIDPPIDTPGKWVHSKDFKGKKSFGYFRCKNCKKMWISAHSFPDYKQGCKSCETKCYPLFLWQNSEEKKKDPTFIKEETIKPHDKERCEACIAGICSNYHQSQYW